MTSRNQDQVLSKIKEILEAVVGADPAEITTETTLLGDLRLESIDIVDLSFEIERAYASKVDFVRAFQEARAKAKNQNVDLSVGDLVRLVMALP